MKKVILLFVAITMIASYTLTAQVAVNTDGSNPDGSAILDVKSTDKGFLPPRMSTAQMNAISSPSAGLMIFNTTINTVFFYDGSAWRNLYNDGESGGPISYDGQTYQTVIIGTQTWMAENLNIGTMINSTNGGTNSDGEQTDNSTIEKYCYYNTPTYCDTYGGLYQWNEMMQYVTAEVAQGICPTGWHIPTDAEWKTMEIYLGMSQAQADATGWRGVDEGGKLKETGITHWASPNTGATNSSGFKGLPGGLRSSDASFLYLTGSGRFWSSNTLGSDAWVRFLIYSGTQVRRDYDDQAFGISVRCLKNVTVVPTVTTDAASNITTTSADCAGEIVDVGWSTITQYGHCWSISTEPTIDDDLSNLGSTNTAGTFISNLHDLESYTTYYVRAYAINSEGINYSANSSFTTAIEIGAPCPATITYGGQLYNTVLIGDQCWFRENLNIGTMIDGSVDQTQNTPTEIIEKYCYGDQETNCDTYGGLYQWAEVVQYLNGASNTTSWDPVPTANVQGICPTGWHLPTDTEWKTMEMELGMSQEEADNSGLRGTDEGGKMKEAGTTHWLSPNTGATNSSGFTGLPGGYRSNGSFYYLGVIGYWWSSSENGPGAQTRRLADDSEQVARYNFSKAFGRSVRCLKN